MKKYVKSQIVICGAGPSGLAAALLFHQYGWQEIIVVERNESPSAFDRGKAFNYQIDPRGQQMLERLGIRDMLEEYGLPNTDFTLTFVKSDGTTKTVKPPIIDENRGTAYWTRRNDFIRMLQVAVDKQNADGRIKLLYGHSFSDIKTDGQGVNEALIIGPNGEELRYQPTLLLGCDGLHSSVRLALQSIEGKEKFEMVKHPSPANQLAYKVLNFPSKFSVNADITEVDDHTTAFSFVSRHKEKGKKFALFALPVANAQVPRSINLICPKTHKVWDFTDGPSLLDFLSDSLPQLDIRSLISTAEAQEFAAMKPGYFPAPQYCRQVYARIGEGEEVMDCLLIGDSAHSFPPDLGLGVNSALEDLVVLERLMSEGMSVPEKTFKAYQTQKLPENAALVRLVQTVHPYQYNQTPWRLKLWMIGFLIRVSLNKVVPKLIDKPAFLLSHNFRMPYQEMERRKKRTDFIVRIVFPVIILINALLLMKALLT